MDDAIDVGPQPVDLGMDEDLAVALAFSANLLALEITDHDVLGRDLIKAMTVRLHDEKRRVARHAYGNMPAGKVALPRVFEDLACVDQLAFCFVQRHGGSFSVNRP